MELKETVLQAKTKAASQAVANWVGPDQDRFDQLMHLFLHDEPRVTQRAAWIVSMVADQDPFQIEKYLAPLILNLRRDDLNIAVRRNTLRILQEVEIPEELQGHAYDLCFNFLSNPAEPIAIRAFSMTVLFNIAKTLPELLPELKVLVEEVMPYGSAGLKSRGKHILIAMRKMGL